MPCPLNVSSIQAITLIDTASGRSPPTFVRTPLLTGSQYTLITVHYTDWVAKVVSRTIAVSQFKADSTIAVRCYTEQILDYQGNLASRFVIHSEPFGLHE